MPIKNALKQLSPAKPAVEEEVGEFVAEEEELPPLDRKELVDLIAIRQYVVNATANPTMDRPSVNYLNGSLILIDKKILGILQSPQFKEYINYSNVGSAIKQVVEQNNIKSGLQRNPYTGQLEKINK